MLPRLRAPLVLIHGLFGTDRFRLGGLACWDYFRGLPEALRQAGNRVLVARLSPTAGIRERAKELHDFLQRELPQGPMHLLGHSMGGLDARYVISQSDLGRRVLSLTTLGTPHRGCSFADWAIPRLVPLLAPVFRYWQLPMQGIFDVTTKAMARFNEEIRDRAGVRYFSVAGRWQWNWTNPNWQLSYPVVQHYEGENDGLVSIQSAQWGQDFEIWDGDHMNLANWPEPFVSAEQDRLKEYATLLARLPDEGESPAVEIAEK